MKTKIVYFIITLLTVVTSVVLFVFYKNRNTVPSQQIVHTSMIASSSPYSIKDTKLEDVQTNVAQIEGALNQVTDEGEKRLLLARKLSWLIMARSMNIEQKNYVESQNILNELVFKSDTVDIGKKIGLAAMIGLFDSWCYNGRIFYSFLTKNSPYYAKIYNNYIANYKTKIDSQQIASMLTFSDFSNDNMSVDNMSSDRMFVGTSAKLSAMNLRSFYKDLSKEDWQKEYDRLGKNLDRHASSQLVTYITYESGTLYPQLSTAFAFDVHESLLSNNNNETIDKRYEEAWSNIRNYKGNSRVSTHMSNAILSVYYLDSIGRRYGEKAAVAKQKEIVPVFLQSIASSKELKDVFAGYLKDGIYGDSKWEMQKRNFMYLAKYNKDLKSYLLSIGIREEDINKISPDWSTWNVRKD